MQFEKLNADKVATVKNLLCHLLIVWMAFMSGGATAHAIQDFAHEAMHVQTHTQHVSQNQALDNETATTADTNHADTCTQSHCSHGHTTGLPTPYGACVKANSSALAPTSRFNWVSNPTVNNIERPKWPFTTPAVVNLLT